MYFAASPETVESFYKAFVDAYPSQDERLEAARYLATNPVLPIPAPTRSGFPIPPQNPIEKVGREYNPGRFVLLTQWGSDDEALQRTGEYIWGIKPEVDKFVGQKIMIFTQGSPEAALEDEDRVVNDATFWLGTIAGRNVPNGAPVANVSFLTGGEARPNGSRRVVMPERDGVPAPWLAAGAAINLQQAREITASFVHATIGEPFVEKQGVVFSSAASVAGDQETYDSTLQIVKRPILVGNAATKDFLKQLIKRYPDDRQAPLEAVLHKSVKAA